MSQAAPPNAQLKATNKMTARIRAIVACDRPARPEWLDRVFRCVESIKRLSSTSRSPRFLVIALVVAAQDREASMISVVRHPNFVPGSVRRMKKAIESFSISPVGRVERTIASELPSRASENR